MSLRDKIETRQAIVSVVGLGYVGLPLAVAFAQAGFRVVGIDVDQDKVESINRGQSYVQDVPSEALNALEGDGLQPKKLSATTSFDPLADCDAVIVCVPTPLGKTRDPDVSYILSAIDEIVSRLHRGMLLVLESTTYPGTTEELVLPRLQAAKGENFIVGSDVFLAFSPERIDPGRSDWTISNTPRVVGGVTPDCTAVARALYECVVEETIPVSSPRVAEMAKLLENTFRATNIALVNEMSIICDRLGIDVWEVIEAASTKPFGFMPFYPGPGLGGHCLPVDPRYLAWKLQTLDYNARFVQLAEEINLGMPRYWTAKIQDSLNRSHKPVKGSNILVLGVSYKRDTADTRDSPALDIIDQLLDKGANVSYYDPFVPSLKAEAFEMESVGDFEFHRSLEGSDCVVIITDHSQIDYSDVQAKAPLVVDTRNALSRSSRLESAIVNSGQGNA